MNSSGSPLVAESEFFGDGPVFGQSGTALLEPVCAYDEDDDEDEFFDADDIDDDDSEDTFDEFDDFDEDLEEEEDSSADDEDL